MKEQNAYAKLGGVDPSKIQGFKEAMANVGKRTLKFPNHRGVYIDSSIEVTHGATYSYHGRHRNHLWCKTTEGLGNKNYIPELMYQEDPKRMNMKLFGNVMKDNMLMAVNDVIAQGAMPVVYTDEVAAGDSDWFADTKRSAAIAEGAYELCKEVGMALPAGESPALKFLVNARPPVKSCPVMSGTVTGIIAPATRVIQNIPRPNDWIIGVDSSGIHANGVSLLIAKALGFKDHFFFKLPNGKTFGEEVCTPTRSYVHLVETLLTARVKINKLLPGTGGGISKLAVSKRELNYRVHTWPKDKHVPFIFEYIKNLGVDLKTCFETFNMGIGYYIFAHKNQVDTILRLGHEAGYKMMIIGRVEEPKKGEASRQVFLEPYNMTFAAHGD